MNAVYVVDASVIHRQDQSNVTKNMDLLEKVTNIPDSVLVCVDWQQSRRGEDVAGDDGGQHYTAGEGPVPMSTDMDEDRSTETPHGGDSNEDQVYRAGGDM